MPHVALHRGQWISVLKHRSLLREMADLALALAAAVASGGGSGEVRTSNARTSAWKAFVASAKPGILSGWIRVAIFMYARRTSSSSRLR